MGFCPQCRSEGGLEAVSLPRSVVAGGHPVSLVKARGQSVARIAIGIEEIDRVLGGGLVPGAAVLLGGEPGVGKSTLLLQVAGALAGGGVEVLVASAEESVDQVALRAHRIGVDDPGIHLLAEQDVDVIIATAREMGPALLVVDSVQAASAAEIGGTPGGVAQVRETAARLIHFAKDSGVPVVIVGHVTKDGSIAGPKVVEHAVDVVLYLEGDPERGVRMLRGIKNRFGATQQVGLFEMQERGLAVLDERSLVPGREGRVAGAVLFPTVDGRRPLVVEVQALVSETTIPQPRRSVKGVESARVHQLLAVLERHAGLSFAGHDVYVGVVGGVKVREPAADLPVALALASSRLDVSLPPVAAWGEVGLSGEVRAVAHSDRRVEEAHRLGVERMVHPNGAMGTQIAECLARAGIVVPSGSANGRGAV